MVGSRHTHSVTSILAIHSQSSFKTDVPTDDVRTYIDVRCFDADTLSRSRLSGYGSIRISEVRTKVQFYDTTHVEHNIVGGINIHQTIE